MPPKEEAEAASAVDVDDDDDEEETGSEAADSDAGSVASSTGGTGSGGKKKKKKKKKKSKGSADAGSPSPSSPASASDSHASTSKVDKSECDKRFNAAMEAIRSGEDMWIKLGSANIYDAKTKKLADAIKGNGTVTSVDLSNNHISDEGAQALAAALAMNGAPELIELDLRGNPFTAAGLTSLEGLKKMRKQLVVHMGSTSPAKSVPEGEGMPSSKEGKDVAKGPMFRKYFQTGNDEDDSDDEVQVSDGGIAPEELWKQIAEDVAAGGSSIPQLGARLQQLILLLNRELGTLQLPHVDTVTDGSRPHIKGCIMNLEVLDKILSIVPGPVTTQFSKDPQRAVGSHRVWAAEVVAMLLAPNIMALDRLVASSKLVPRVLQVSLQHPLCSALHTRALRVLRSCCVSKVAQLYGPLFTSGLGAGLTVDGSDEPCPSLQQQLADLVTPQLNVASGVRPAIFGFALEACKVLQACCDEANRDSIYNSNVARLLQMDSKWAEFVGEEGALQACCKEQEGDLGGPRAARVPMDDSADLAELAGGGLISGHEILALLQGMQVSGGLGSMLGS